MNLVYEGENQLICSAVRRTTEVLNSTFFQNHLMSNLSEEESEHIKTLLNTIHQTNYNVHIKTYWNPFKRQSITYDINTQSLNINIASLKKSRRIISKQLVKNYSLLQLNKIYGGQENGNLNKVLALRMSSLANYYA
ncbi:hypothetical protein [Leeuwenhoekiella marinoflava]|uniref:hypothetical protein n=1 Tax=Leeuwenhoekiella marinoflava TaxID=988 RepID=UPI003001B7F4